MEVVIDSGKSQRQDSIYATLNVGAAGERRRQSNLDGGERAGEYGSHAVREHLVMTCLTSLYSTQLNGIPLLV